MKGLVHRILRRRVIGLTILLICLLSAKTHPSTDKPETYVSRSEYSNLLFAQQKEASVRAERTDSIKLKDPNMAILYAVVPGIVIHGAGHFYAGKRTTAAILFTSGFIGGSFVFIGGLTGLEKRSPTDIGYMLIITGAVLFTGSWTYDLIGAPGAVKKQNQELLKGKSLNLKLEFNENNRSLKVGLIKQF
jgi:hypothetical protein